MALFDDTDGELCITNMILHVVGADTEFVPSTARVVEHEEFFITRIRDTYADSVYSFNINSAVKARLERMSTGLESFEDGSRELSRLFSAGHVGSSKAGALFIFELGCESQTVKFYSFIKYDFHQAIEQTDGQDGSVLRMIVKALIADKKAIQKSALVKIKDGIAQLEISATDRDKRAPEIADYFVTFLDVSRVLSDEDLNNKLLEVLKSTLQKCKDDLPSSVPKALKEAKDILRRVPSIDENSIINAILSVAGDPTDEKIRASIEDCARRRIKANKIEGLAFRPDLTVLGKAPIVKIRTAEGVEVRYPDHAMGGTVVRVPRDDGGETITIQTAKIVDEKIGNK